MTNKTILAFAFLDAMYRHYGSEFRLWHEMLESDREQHLVTVQLFIDNPEITARQTHEMWVERRLADGWQHAQTNDPENKLNSQLLPFEQLPKAAQDAEIAGVAALNEALPYARDNRLPPELEFEVMKRIAVSNANYYLEEGEMLGLNLLDQPSSMLFWGSLANVRHHIQLLETDSGLSDQHEAVINEGLSELNRALSEPIELQPAIPGGRRDQGPFNCSEDHMEHGLMTLGAVYTGDRLGKTLQEASDQGYCERCLTASQVGSTLTVLISGMRREGRNDAEIMTVISDLIQHGFEQADAGGPVFHPGLIREPLQ